MWNVLSSIMYVPLLFVVLLGAVDATTLCNNCASSGTQTSWFYNPLHVDIPVPANGCYAKLSWSTESGWFGCDSVSIQLTFHFGSSYTTIGLPGDKFGCNLVYNQCKSSQLTAVSLDITCHDALVCSGVFLDMKITSDPCFQLLLPVSLRLSPRFLPRLLQLVYRQHHLLLLPHYPLLLLCQR